MSWTVHPPAAEARRLSAGNAAGSTLVSWLTAHDFPLNTRCGGRGLCQGCQVEANGEKIRACQTACQDLPTPLDIRIPARSWRDASLHGVSAFELRVPVTIASGRTGLGLALDLGTTTVAGALWDLSNGQCLATQSRANAQRAYGDNVVARISYAVEQTDGLNHLQAALIDETIRPLWKALFALAGTDDSALQQVIAAGNPAILHTLLGQSLLGLSRYPFAPAFHETQTVACPSLGLPSEAPLWTPPAWGPFVGADIVAGAAALGLHEVDAPQLLIDFGTNGEIVLATPTQTLVTATAAGPAFEGGRLTAGATARPGVISHLAWDPQTGWSTDVIPPHRGPPTGLSGAAYVDALALAWQHGMVNARGRLDPSHPAVASAPDEDGDPVRFLSISPTLRITEADIAELLQAKAAIAGGVATLLEEAELEPEDLATVYVAGGFGYHLQPEHAVACGLLPAVPPACIQLVGNTALGGASLFLLAQKTPTVPAMQPPPRYLELNQLEAFEDHYIDAMGFES